MTAVIYFRLSAGQKINIYNPQANNYLFRRLKSVRVRYVKRSLQYFLNLGLTKKLINLGLTKNTILFNWPQYPL